MGSLEAGGYFGMEQQHEHEQPGHPHQPQQDREQWEDERIMTVDDILNFYAGRQ